VSEPGEHRAPARAVATVAATTFGTLVRTVVRTVGDWLPIAAAAALVAHLAWLGLRPVLDERARLEAARERIAEETRVLAAELSEIERLERATEDPIYQERLRWQWRLGDREPREVEAREANSADLPIRAERVDATPIDDEAVLQGLAEQPPAAPTAPSGAPAGGLVR
jgi:hypothetical protein